MSETPTDDEEESIGQSGTETSDAQAAVSTDYKVRGRKDAQDGTGVLGHNTATTGSAHGVEGVTDSADAGAAGTYGEATPANGRTYGVHGVSNSTGGTLSNPAGVRGHAPAGDGSSADGVHGTTAGTGFFDNFLSFPVYAAGVSGEAQATTGVAYTAGVLGTNRSTSGTGHGVLGRTSSVGAEPAGVYGEATQASGETYGVRARTNADVPNAAAVFADQRNSNGASGIKVDMRGSASAFQNGILVMTDEHTSEAIFADQRSTTATSPTALLQTQSTNAPALQAIGNGGGAIDAGGDVDVTGHVDVGDVGFSAYLASDQTIQNTTTTTVAFDTLQDGRDDFGGLDTSTGAYTVQEPGDYHVDFLINWADFFEEGDLIDYSLEINGSTTGGIAGDTTVGVASDPLQSFSKTLFGLAQGDTVRVRVFHNNASGSAMDIAGGDSGTHLTVAKVG